MATGLPLPVHMHCIQHSRFTKQDGWLLRDLSLSLSGNIAVTGSNKNTDRTSLDVCSPVRNSHSRDKPKIFYSKEFDKYELEGTTYWGRRVSFVDSYDDNRGLVIVTGLGYKLEVFDLNQDRVLKSRKVTLVNHGGIDCLCVREREIFIGFVESNKINVYDVTDLNEIKSIILQGFQDGYSPYDMTAITDRLFVCEIKPNEESNQRSLIFYGKNGKILSELTKPTETRWYTNSVTVCVPLGVVAVVWFDSWSYKQGDRHKIVFYSLFSPHNSSFLIVEIESGVFRIRISDRGDRMVTTNHLTGEVKVYDMANIFTYNQLKTSLTSQLQTDDCLRLADFFALPKDKTDTTRKTDKPTENFLLALEKTGLLQPAYVDRLTEAFTELKIRSSCSSLVDFYQNTRTSAFSKEIIQKLQAEINVLQTEKQQITERLETANKRAEENMIQVQKLQDTLKGTEKRLQEAKDLHQKTVRARNMFRTERDQYHLQLSSLKGELESSKKTRLQTEKFLLKMKDILEKSAQAKQATKAELEQYKLHSSEKSMTLGGFATEEHFTETRQVKPSRLMQEQLDSDASPKSEYFQESAIGRKFSKLLVDLQLELTKDHCVLLATYFTFPKSKVDLIQKDNGTPALTLLSVMKDLGTVNMYDVTNLQKALDYVKLSGINNTFVKPYQRRIDPSLYEQNKVPQQDY